MPLRKAFDTMDQEPVKLAPTVRNGISPDDGVHSVGLCNPVAKPPTTPYPQSYGDAKGRQISRQGLFQAALQSPALMQYCADIQAYLTLVRLTAEAGLGFVNENTQDYGDAIVKAVQLTKPNASR